MSKSMTRKGLAIVSATALSLVGLSAPSFGAQADTSKVSLAPSDGTAYAVVAATLTGTFQLEANEAANIVGGGVSFLVEDADGVVFPVVDDGLDGVTTNLDGTDIAITNAKETWARTAAGVVTVTAADTVADDASLDGIDEGDIIYIAAGVFPDGGGAGDDTSVPEGYYTVTADTDGDGAVGGTVSSFSFVDGYTEALVAQATVTDADGVIVLVTRDADDNSFVVATTVADNTENELLTLTTMGEASATATVTAWVDDDNDGVIDGTEYASPARTVTWLAADDISVSSIDWTVNLGGTNAAAEVTFSPAINWDQSEELDALITNADGQFSGDAAFAVDADGVVTFDDDTDAAAAITAGYVTIKTYTESGNELISTNRIKVVDNDVDDVVVSVATGTNVAQSADDADVTLRSEDGTRVSVTVTVVDADDDPISGVVVTVNEAGDGNSALDADADIEVGGEAVDADDASFDEVTLTTNADGEATLVITSVDATDADALDLTFTAEGVDQDITFTWADATLVANITSSVLADDAAAVTDFWLGTGNSTTATFVVYDQFGSVADNGTFRVKTEINQVDADGDALDAVFKYSKVTNGVASVTISDEAESEEDVTAEFTLQEWDADADNWGAAAIADDNITGVTNTYTTAEDEATVVDVDAFADQAAGDADDNLAIPFTTALEASNAFLGGANDQALVADAESVSITGAVSLESTGAAYAGGTVTISGSSNLLFTNNVADADAANFVMAFGSLTATLDGNGDFSFLVYGNVTGEYELTITSGGTSETVDIEIDTPQDAAGAGIDDVTIDIAGPAYVMPGSTYIATITPKDAFGNAIPTDDAALEVTWDGPGLISGNLPTETGADGTVRVYILFGQNETGSGELSVTYWGLDGLLGGANADDDVTNTATVTLGAEPAPAADTKVNAGSFKGYVAIYAKGHEGKRLSAKVGNDWVVVPALASNFVRVVEYTGAGYTIAVRIYIDRVLVDTITVTTK